MKLALALCLVLSATKAIAQVPANQVPPEFSDRGPVTGFESRVLAPLGGGDSFATATEFTALPFTDIGTNCGFTDDYAFRCGWVLGQDVVYRYVPPADECVDISLCGSNFDTIVSVIAADTLVTCNNDGCGSQGSRISRLSLQGGNTYYFVIDNAGVACGTYYFSVTACCDVSCPPGAVTENPEPCCPAPGVPYPCPAGAENVLSCGPNGVDVCGTYYSDGGFRDTDWYKMAVAEPSMIQMEVTAESPTLIAIMAYQVPPGTIQPLSARFSDGYCATTYCATGVPAGTYYLYVAPMDFDGIPCGTRYTVHASCTPSGATAMSGLHGNDSYGVPVRVGESVSVLGVVTGSWPVGSESRFTMQDDTGGMAVLGSPSWCPNVADQVHLTGIVAQTNGWTVLGPPLTFTFLHAGASEPTPVTVTVDDVNAAYESDGTEPLESKFIRIYDMEIRNVDGTAVVPGAVFESGADYQLVSLKTGRSTVLRILGDANDCGAASLAGTAIPTGCAITVTGVLAQFDPTPGHRSGYRVVPRYLNKSCSVPAVLTTWARLKAQYR